MITWRSPAGYLIRTYLVPSVTVYEDCSQLRTYVQHSSSLKGLAHCYNTTQSPELTVTILLRVQSSPLQYYSESRAHRYNTTQSPELTVTILLRVQSSLWQYYSESRAHWDNANVWTYAVHTSYIYSLGPKLSCVKQNWLWLWAAGTTCDGVKQNRRNLTSAALKTEMVHFCASEQNVVYLPVALLCWSVRCPVRSPPRATPQCDQAHSSMYCSNMIWPHTLLWCTVATWFDHTHYCGVL
jgi:hypothetical protein